MTTIRITITLKPGVLDAQGQAVLQGLRTLGTDQVSAVRVGRYIELTVPDGITATDVDQMCQRFLANPLLEEWRIDDPRRTPLSIGERTG
jgi:phosphoribosylformylglycinamidine synthase